MSQGQCWNRNGTEDYNLSLAAASATCAAGSVTANLPSPTWAQSLSACGGEPIDAACAEPTDTCVPQPANPFAEGVCVVRSGDMECPAGYPNKSVYHRMFEDTRDCPDVCSCTATGATCSVDVQRHNALGCNSFNPTTVNVESGVGQVCVVSGATIQSAEIQSVQVDDAGACTPGAASLTGEATPSDPVTVCCM
jgi:hypothetical protein